MATTPKTYIASGRILAGGPAAVENAVRRAVLDLQERLHAQGIDVSFADIALLGHSESWDHEGKRWVHVRWDA